MAEAVYIIGIGDDGMAGLTQAAVERIRAAEILLGSESALRLVTESTAQRLVVGAELEQILTTINQNADCRIVVLATGDPLFYGTARYLCDRLGKDRFEVIPHVSSMQLAFARVKESWDEAYLTNLATQPLERVIERVRTAHTVGLFTSDEALPNRVADVLVERGLDYFTAYVCENLGSPDERVTAAELTEIRQMAFGPLNVMILVRKPDVPDRPREMLGRRMFGNPDEAFLQSQPKRGLLTPAEVRSMALAELDLGITSTVWDVGAGSGSVAIEAAMIASGGQVFAIEMDPEDYQLISANADRFGVSNLTPVLGQAPGAWETLPDPDAIFVGGTGRQVQSIVEQAWERLRVGGRLVVHVGSVENVTGIRQSLKPHAGEANVWLVQISRGTLQLETLRFESLNPSFLIAAVKE